MYVVVSDDACIVICAGTTQPESHLNKLSTENSDGCYSRFNVQVPVVVFLLTSESMAHHM